jgi:membrane-associated protein
MEHIAQIIIGFGYVGVALAVFAESGILIGAFLPGDSLLFTAGLLASQGHFNIALLIVIVTLSAILGDSVGYYFGRRVGPALFTREDSLLFRRSHVTRAKEFYDRHGKKAIVMARFVPIVRTFAPIVAGVGNMDYKTFIAYNVWGGILWGTLLLLLGFGVGSSIPNAGAYLEWIIMGIIVLSILPLAIEYLRQRAKDKKLSK